MSEFSLKGRPFVELCNLLKLQGLCDSGGAAKALIGQGKVSVNGTVELRKRCKVLAGQSVELGGRTIVVGK
jgi:ribosome-associated protein